MVNTELTREIFKCSKNNEQISFQYKDLKKDFKHVSSKKVEDAEFKIKHKEIHEIIDIIQKRIIH